MSKELVEAEKPEITVANKDAGFLEIIIQLACVRARGGIRLKSEEKTLPQTAKSVPHSISIGCSKFPPDQLITKATFTDANYKIAIVFKDAVKMCAAELSSKFSEGQSPAATVWPPVIIEGKMPGCLLAPSTFFNGSKILIC